MLGLKFCSYLYVQYSAQSHGAVDLVARTITGELSCDVKHTIDH